MIEMHHPGQVKLRARAQLAQDVEQGRGVGAAGQGDRHARDGAGELMPLNRPTNRLGWTGRPREDERGARLREKGTMKTVRNGAGGRTRTADPALMRRVL